MNYTTERMCVAVLALYSPLARALNSKDVIRFVLDGHNERRDEMPYKVDTAEE